MTQPKPRYATSVFSSKTVLKSLCQPFADHVAQKPGIAAGGDQELSRSWAALGGEVNG